MGLGFSGLATVYSDFNAALDAAARYGCCYLSCLSVFRMCAFGVRSVVLHIGNRLHSGFFLFFSSSIFLLDFYKMRELMFCFRIVSSLCSRVFEIIDQNKEERSKRALLALTNDSASDIR